MPRLYNLILVISNKEPPPESKIIKELEVGPGDFIAFSTPSVPHHLKNPFDQELLYLMGGENREFEVADFPRLGKRMVKSGEKFEVYEISNAQPFGPLET